MPGKEGIKLNCLVVDDESMGRKLMEENISRIPFLIHVGSCKNAFEAMEILNTTDIDLMFLDIQMPGLTGTDFLNSLPQKPMTIFVTAYPQFALEGYELEVLDYLVKPVSLERFSRAVNKAYQLKELKSKAESPLPPSDNEEESSDSLFVNVEYSLVKINKDEILFIEGMKDYVKIYLANGKKRVITKASLSGMEQKLGPDKFMRVHKSFIIALNKIESIRNQFVKIEDHSIPVSNLKMDELLAKIGYKP